MKGKMISVLLFVGTTIALDCEDPYVSRLNADQEEEWLCPKFKKKNSDGSQCTDPECKEGERWT